jgi:hypothetical protein
MEIWTEGERTLDIKRVAKQPKATSVQVYQQCFDVSLSGNNNLLTSATYITAIYVRTDVVHQTAQNWFILNISEKMCAVTNLYVTHTPQIDITNNKFWRIHFIQFG